jgi:hypothetical protein
MPENTKSKGCCGKTVAAAKVIIRGAVGVFKSLAPVSAWHVSPWSKKTRRDICRSCEHLSNKRLTNFSLCNLCKCNIMLKTRVASESCPDNRWQANIFGLI